MGAWGGGAGVSLEMEESQRAAAAVYICCSQGCQVGLFEAKNKKFAFLVVGLEIFYN